MKRVVRVALLVPVALFALAVVAGPVAIALRESGNATALPGGVRGRIIEVDGHRVHVVEAGSGPPLVLVHGFGASTFDYEESVLEKLARSHRVIAVDLYGFGWSERNDDFAYDFFQWSDQLKGVLDVLGIERASVAGQSLGGVVAAVFAARHPARIDRLVLADAVYPRGEDEIPAVFKALRTPILGELGLGFAGNLSPPGSSEAHRARTRAFASLAGTRKAWLRAIRGQRELMPQLRVLYGQIAAPTLVLHGTEDRFVAFATMQREAPAIRGVRIVPLPGGGHFPHRDMPDRYVQELEAFLR